MTSIRISETNRNKLNELKSEMQLKNIDEVITHLLKINKEQKKMKIYKVIEVIQ